MAIELGIVGTMVKDEPDAKVRATIKGAEISKLESLARKNVMFSGADYDIEIVSLNAIEGGVEVFARAWDLNGQIGFGDDGSVDIERFRIFNPPIMVPDGTKSIEVIRGVECETDNMKEDPEAALLQSLAHTIKCKKEKRDASRIVPGKVGNTTTTLYPSAGAVSPCDGFVGKNGQNVTFANIRANTPTAANFASVSDGYAWPTFLQASTTSNQYAECYRGIFNFDTSVIGSDTISSAVFSLFDVARPSALGAWTMHLNSATPATTDNVVVGDYLLSLAGTTSFGSIAVGSVGASAYNGITLNADGRTYINTSGVTSFGTRSDWDITDTAPSWVSGAASYWQVRASDYAGTSEDPKLVIEHTAVVTSTGNMFLVF